MYFQDRCTIIVIILSIILPIQLHCYGQETEKTLNYSEVAIRTTQLTENVFTTFLFGCIEVSLQRNVV